VENASQRIWFWFYMPSLAISTVGSVRYIQKDLDKIVKGI
jgi:hypothetical protein